jgi:hypothetical protein
MIDENQYKHWDIYCYLMKEIMGIDWIILLGINIENVSFYNFTLPPTTSIQ